MVRSSATPQVSGPVVPAGSGAASALWAGRVAVDVHDAPEAAKPSRPTSKVRRAMAVGGTEEGVMGPHTGRL